MAGSDFLERFRPLGAPGAAVAGGVATRVPDPATELAPVFAALASSLEACEELVAEARRRADAELATARERAAGLKAEARANVGAEQARAAARVMEESAARDAATLDAAAAAAAETRRVGAARLDGLADAILHGLLSDLVGEP